MKRKYGIESSIAEDIRAETASFTKLNHNKTVLDEIVYDNVLLFDQLPGITPLCRFSRYYEDITTEMCYFTSASADWVNYVVLVDKNGERLIREIWERVVYQLHIEQNIPSIIDHNRGRSQYVDLKHRVIDDIFHGKGQVAVRVLTSNTTDAPGFNRTINRIINDILTDVVDNASSMALLQRMGIAIRDFIR